MDTHHFTLRELFDFGWKNTKAHFWFLFQVAILGLLVMGVAHIMGPFSLLVDVFVNISLVSVLLVIVNGGTPTFADLFDRYKSSRIYLSFLLATLLVILIVLVGFALFIIPGIYFVVKFQFYKFLIVDKGLGPVESLKESMRMTDGHFWSLFGFLLAAIIFNLLGLIVFIVPVFFTVLITSIASVYLYKKFLTGGHNHPHEHHHHDHHGHDHAGHTH